MTSLDTSIGEATEAETLPPACYTDPGFYELERRSIFQREWLCLGRVEQVPSVGDYFTVTVADEPLIVVRATDSTIRVLSAVCRHRGAIVTVDVDDPAEPWRGGDCERRGQARTFRCPYHLWTYDLGGQLVACPEMTRSSGFDKADVALPSLAVEEWRGFVFASFDAAAPPLGPRLAALDALLADWHLDEMVGGEPLRLTGLPWNWKVMHENSLELYHADRLHGSLHAAVPSRGLLPTPHDPGQAAIISRVRASHADFALNPIERALFPPIPTLTQDERSLSVFALVPPTLLFGVNSDSAFYRLVLPAGVDRIDIVFDYLVPAAYRSLPRFEELVAFASDSHLRINRQDFAINASIQRGLRSSLAARGRYSWQEEGLVHFNRWLVERYRAAGVQG